MHLHHPKEITTTKVYITIIDNTCCKVSRVLINNIHFLIEPKHLL